MRVHKSITHKGNHIEKDRTNAYVYDENKTREERGNTENSNKSNKQRFRKNQGRVE